MEAGYADPRGRRERWTASWRRRGRAGARRRSFCDIDGTISPIAPTPADARGAGRPSGSCSPRSPQRLGLVAFVTGRALEDGRRMIAARTARPTSARTGSRRWPPTAPAHRSRRRSATSPRSARSPSSAARDLDCEALGIVLEDKRTVLAVHYRLAPDAAATRHEILTRVVEPARARGLAIATGHFAFEVRPPLPFTKGSAVAAAARGRRLPRGDRAAATTSPTSPRSQPCATGRERDARRARLRRRGGHRRDAAPRAGRGRRAGARHARRARGAGAAGQRPSAPSDEPGPRRRPRAAAGRRGARAQRPPNSGARFSRNAAMPSRLVLARRSTARRGLARSPWPVAMSVSAAALHGGLAVAHRQRALAGELVGQLQRLGHELVLRGPRPGRARCAAPRRRG